MKPELRHDPPAGIRLHSHQYLSQGLEAQLLQRWAMYTALAPKANRYQVVQQEHLLMEI